MPLIVTILAALILLFLVIVFCFAPGKNIPRYGIIIDPPVSEMAQNEKTSHFLVLLTDGQAVKVPKPEWFVHSERKTIIIQETTTMFLRTKKYSFYNEEKYLPLKKNLFANNFNSKNTLKINTK